MEKCIGCGITLQYDNELIEGYTENKENKLCKRCFQLKNYGIYKNVDKNNNDYKKILKSINQNDYILYITDVLTLDCLGIEEYKNVNLVITKKDILPTSVKKEKIINYMKKKYQNLSHVFLISSKTEEGIEELYKTIIKEKKEGYVYLTGTTNSGKSTLINKLIELYGENKESILTVSIHPSTTLDKIEIPLKKITLIDTPGLINEKNITNYLTTAQLKQITPKKTIKPKSCQIEGKGSIIIGEFVRIDYETNKKNSIVIYTSNNVKIHFASLKNNIYYDYPKYKFNLSDKKDIVIPGLGFIKCTGSIKLTIYAYKKTSPEERENLI